GRAHFPGPTHRKAAGYEGGIGSGAAPGEIDDGIDARKDSSGEVGGCEIGSDEALIYRVELRLGDDGAKAGREAVVTRFDPIKLNGGRTASLGVFDADVVVLSGDEGDGSGIFGQFVASPIINQ